MDDPVAKRSSVMRASEIRDEVSRPFCDYCDRVRLTADGLLYTCLYDSRSINLFDLLTSDYEQARAALDELLRSKQSGGCRSKAGSTITLPSFSAMGG